MRAPWLIIWIALFVTVTISIPVKAEEKQTCSEILLKKVPTNKRDWRIFLLHKKSALYREADTSCNGILEDGELNKHIGRQEQLISSELFHVGRRLAGGKTFSMNKKGELVPSLISSDEPTKPDKECGSGFLLRDGWEDIGLFGCPKEAKEASGASFGFGSDDVLDNESWSAKGVVGYALKKKLVSPRGTQPYVTGYAFGPAIKFQRLTNSAVSQKSKETDVLSFTGTGEIAIARLLGGTQYFRARGAFNTDFEGDPKSWSATAEWQPYTNSDRFALSSPHGLGPLRWRVDPILRFQYTEEVDESNQPLFDDHDYAIRLGPVLGLTVQPAADEVHVPLWLQSASLLVTYEWLTDFASDNEYDLFTANLNFPIDEAGHFGIKLSYQNGEVEETGKQIDQTQIGLSAKW
jgi:hypothetical protein